MLLLILGSIPTEKAMLEKKENIWCLIYGFADWPMQCGREAIALLWKMLAVFLYFFIWENNVGLWLLMVCLSCNYFLNLASLLFPYLSGKQNASLQSGDCGNLKISILWWPQRWQRQSYWLTRLLFLPHVYLTLDKPRIWKHQTGRGPGERWAQPLLVQMGKPRSRERKGLVHGHTAHGSRTRSKTQGSFS